MNCGHYIGKTGLRTATQKIDPIHREEGIRLEKEYWSGFITVQ